jgi:hypothetical protein
MDSAATAGPMGSQMVYVGLFLEVQDEDPHNCSMGYSVIVVMIFRMQSEPMGHISMVTALLVFAKWDIP